jgi:hypothetical protein
MAVDREYRLMDDYSTSPVVREASKPPSHEQRGIRMAAGASGGMFERVPNSIHPYTFQYAWPESRSNFRTARYGRRLPPTPTRDLSTLSLRRTLASSDTHPSRPSFQYSTGLKERRVAQNSDRQSRVDTDAVGEHSNEDVETSSIATSAMSEYTTASHDVDKPTKSTSPALGKHHHSFALRKSISNIRTRLQESSAATSGAQMVESLRRRVQGSKIRRNSKLTKGSKAMEIVETKSEDGSVYSVDEEKALVQKAVQRKPGVREKASQFVDHLGEMMEDRLRGDEGNAANRLFFAGSKRG